MEKDMYQKGKMRAEKKMKFKDEKEFPKTCINWDSGIYRQLYSNH